MGKIRLLRKIIFIGEANGYTIFLDTENNVPLKAEKSKLLDTEKAGKYLIYIPGLMLIFSFVGKKVYDFLENSYLAKVEVAKAAILALLLGILFWGVFTIWLHQILYKDVKKAELATKQEFGIAVRNSNIWLNSSDKKVTKDKKVYAWVITLSMIFLGIVAIVMTLNVITLNMKADVSDAVMFGGAVGTFLFAIILMVWENNMIRWLNVVEKYQERKLWREKDE